jgi:hypothetical protein
VRGLAQRIETRGGNTRKASNTPRVTVGGQPGSAPAPNTVIGVLCSGDLAVHRDQIKDTIARGNEQRPDAVWVCIEPKSDRMTHDVMLSLDIEPVVLPMIEAWRRRHDEHGYDLRRVWRDNELLHLCDELIVFHKRTGNSPWRDRAASGLYEGRLFVVELGAAPKARAKRKTRKPVGT